MPIDRSFLSKLTNLRLLLGHSPQASWFSVAVAARKHIPLASITIPVPVSQNRLHNPASFLSYIASARRKKLRIPLKEKP